jgi:NAD(P)-dependent dehydrogenase (short-subunit alcohol dehydrogenase family)
LEVCDMTIRNARIAVIGGSSGMGLAAAKLLVENGAHVIIASRSEERLKKAAEEIGRNVETYQLDALHETQVKAFFEQTGEIDHLVTPGAAANMGSFLSQSTPDARFSFDGKFWVQYLAAKHGAPKIRGNGLITFFSGVAAVKPIQGLTVIAAVNGAVEALGRSLAVELAPIRVNTISPGIVDTPAYEGMPEAMKKAYFDSMAAKLPVKHVAKPEEIAESVLYLIKSEFTTGTVLEVSGGDILV